MMIVGRLIQGTGGAGISATSAIVISDLTTLKERGIYSGILFGIFGLGIAAGPPIGGFIVQHTHWHWIFWLNLPIGGIALIMLFLFLHTPFHKVPTIKFDLIGNFILVGSIVSVLIALSWADTRYTWSSWQILVPFIIGLLGMIVFHFWESRYSMPIVPTRLFSNRTSTIAFFSTFMASALTVWRLFFISVYIQGILLASPGYTGVILLPSVLVFIPATAISGFTLAKFGRYKPIHICGFALTTLAVGLYIDLDENWSIAKIVIYQLIAGLGSGMLMNTTLPAAQAALEPADSLAAASFYAYVRAFGSVWGIAIPAAIFNSCFANYSDKISDDAVRQLLSGGNAYSHVSSAYVSSLPSPVQGEVIQAYLSTLKVLWGVCLGLTAISLLLTFFEKEIAMRTTLDGAAHGKSDAKVLTKDEESTVTSSEHFPEDDGWDFEDLRPQVPRSVV
jgi:MFS family permease